MPRSLQLTSDGSHTVHDSDLDVLYHSYHGAITESSHVFIDAGLRHFAGKEPERKSIVVFELGFGTGLNALLTLLEARRLDLDVRYVAVEPYPLEDELVNDLNYCTLLKATPEDTKTFLDMHAIAMREGSMAIPNFSLEIIASDLESAQLENGSFDIVYYDAFAPVSQAELWHTTPLSKIFKTMTSGAVLTTYCAQGQFKRNLREVGFGVESIPGPPGKREMVRAIRP